MVGRHQNLDVFNVVQYLLRRSPRNLFGRNWRRSADVVSWSLACLSTSPPVPIFNLWILRRCLSYEPTFYVLRTTPELISFTDASGVVLLQIRKQSLLDRGIYKDG